MKFCLALLLFITTSCLAQKNWQLEIMPGVAGYRGDLTQSAIPIKTIGPALAINLKYDRGDMIVMRAGFTFGKISADDKDNKQPSVKARNLSFQTLLWEGSLCAEVNILDPEAYTAYPYVYLGIGAFHFNPYANDNAGKKTYLQPLSTEGEGLPEYPDKKKYSLTQLCVPFGGGWKIKMNEKYAISFELGVRFLFTDYLDDVSGNYADGAILLARKGSKAVEMAYRQTPPPGAGQVRGNPKTNDMYVISGVKLTCNLGKKKKEDK
jgi:hypothetical protein